MAVMVGQVLVWASVMVVATAVDSAKQDVESIFKSVEEFMRGKPDKVSPVNGEGRHRVKEVSQDLRAEFAGSAKDRASVGTAPFPMGVILSDNLYPLVVGKNVNTGMPFVVNLGQQHALVVARGGSDNYRMLIPFPVVVGGSTSPGSSLEDTSLEAVHRSPTAIYNLKQSHYRPDHTRYVSRYPIHVDSYEKYYNINPNQVHDSVVVPPKVPKKYVQPYHNNRHQDIVQLSPEIPRYKTYTTKVPNVRPVNTNYKAVQNIAPYYKGSTVAPVENARAKDVSESVIKYDNGRPQLTYYLEGPRYPTPLPRSRYVSGRHYNHAYREPSPEFHSEHNSDQFSPKFTSSNDDRPSDNNPSNIKTHHNGKLPEAYEGVPKDFKPSPYIGKITEDDDAAGLQPQSEIIQSYDDEGEFTEQDYMDSIRDSPESHSSTGEVRHVTYHADDYLGKIYEDMYYKLPQDVESRSKEHKTTEYHVTRNKHEPELRDEDTSPKYEAEATTYIQNKAETANPKTGPVTFDVPEQKVDSTDR